MKIERDDLLFLYRPEAAVELSKALVECAQFGITMVAGDPSRFVPEANGVFVSGGELIGEGSWSEEFVEKLGALAQQHGREPVTIEWVKCPECGHIHYDAYGGVPCPVADCGCARSYMPEG